MLLMELYKDKILGATRGLDRMRFRGTLRWLSNSRGMGSFMSRSNILLKEFGAWAEDRTRRLRARCEEQAKRLGVQMIYLSSSGKGKEQLARKVATEQGVKPDGSICFFSVLEMCMAPTVRGNKATRELELDWRPRKCLHFYRYFDHPQMGFGHVRLQSWLPFGVTLCLNGRHWLEKQLDRHGVRYIKSDNCFPWLEDFARAQQLLDAQLQSDWPALLNGLLRETCPGIEDLLAPMHFDHYWSAEETEWATDIIFCSARELDRIYPSLLRHAMEVSDAPSVMRYLGRGGQPSPSVRAPRGRLCNDIMSDLRRRHEGIRVKHWVRRNSVKAYNKCGNVLRLEGTINYTRDFKVWRSPENAPERPPTWQKMRKGVADLHRRCEISNQITERYGDSLAAALVEEKLREIVAPACRRRTKDGRRYRALNPWSALDYQMLVFLAKGAHAVNGFRNRDLRGHLFGPSKGRDDTALRRQSGKTSRLLSLLRAHGLIRKIAKENRYVLSEKGRKFSTALLSASNTDVATLMRAAA
jgi:hypothetical protein